MTKSTKTNKIGCFENKYQFLILGQI